MKRLLTILLLVVFANAKSQDINYAKQIIATLCSHEFSGRGYAYGGDKMAAEHIVNQLKALKIDSFDNGYYQKFSISVNTFPEKMEVKIDKEKLIPGVDFLIRPESSSCKFSGELFFYDDNTASLHQPLPFYSDKILVIDTATMLDTAHKESAKKILDLNLLKPKGIIEVVEKLPPFSLSWLERNATVIQIVRDKVPTWSEEVKITIENKFLPLYETQNVAAVLNGKSDSLIVFTAHYDHLGLMGKGTYFPGAHDNASGVAMLLDMAKTLSQKENNYTIVFLFLSAEELGLLGSQYFVENPLFELSKIKFLINLDMLGSGDDGIKVVNGSVFKPEFDKLVEINNKHQYLKQVAIRGAAANSDHYPFYVKGVKSFYLYTLGKYVEYHNINDKADAVPLNKFEEIEKIILEFVDTMN